MVRYGKRSGGRNRDGEVFSRRMVQLTIALVLFVAVYATKGVFPHRIQRLGENVTALIGATTDWEGAFSQLGNALERGESVVDELGDFCVEVFGGSALQGDAVAVLNVPTPLPEIINQKESTAVVRDDHQDMWQFAVVQMVEDSSAFAQSLASRAAVEEPAPLAVGEVCLIVEPKGESLPAGYTDDMLSLGDMACTTPVLGAISSGFGYRIHPISGQSAIHNGLDIVASKGTPICAFGDGVVEYVGESTICGKYFRIDHENGVSSFYAHCNDIYVSQGSSVRVGQEVAEVGATGEVTGAHLHFELRCNGVLIDPSYYIDVL